LCTINNTSFLWNRIHSHRHRRGTLLRHRTIIIIIIIILVTIKLDIGYSSEKKPKRITNKNTHQTYG
jgi:hypothetical protein